MSDRRRRVLGLALKQLEVGLTRPSPSAISRESGISLGAVKADVAALRMWGLIPPSSGPAMPGVQPVARTRRASMPDDRARLRSVTLTEKTRGDFEAAARSYEAERSAKSTAPIAYRFAHDRLYAALTRYARRAGVHKCACDGWRYVPMPAERSFVRERNRAVMSRVAAGRN